MRNGVAYHDGHGNHDVRLTCSPSPLPLSDSIVSS
jgi:hypothetical protein